MRPGSKLADCIDWDGMAYYVDPVQQRVAQMVCEHDQLVRQLERQLSATKTALSKCSAHYGQSVVDGRDDLVRPLSTLAVLTLSHDGGHDDDNMSIV